MSKTKLKIPIRDIPFEGGGFLAEGYCWEVLYACINSIGRFEHAAERNYYIFNHIWVLSSEQSEVLNAMFPQFIRKLNEHYKFEAEAIIIVAEEYLNGNPWYQVPDREIVFPDNDIMIHLMWMCVGSTLVMLSLFESANINSMQEYLIEYFRGLHIKNEEKKVILSYVTRLASSHCKAAQVFHSEWDTMLKPDNVVANINELSEKYDISILL